MDFLNSFVSIAAKVVVAFFVAVAAFFGIWNTRAVVAPAPAPAQQTLSPASTTPAVATTTQKVTAKTKQKPTQQIVSQNSSDLPSALDRGAAGQNFVQQPAATLAPEELNITARAALVNVLCTTGSGGSFKPISGSGVVVDSRGIILTNAHVAQFFLLRDYPTPGNIDCVIRTGGPATPKYRAQLLYLPPAWVSENAPQVIAEEPKGTGENDYAFLLITGATDPSLSLPSSFAYLAISTSAPIVGNQMLLAAYPAGFLDGTTIQMNLYPASALAMVQELFSFSGGPQVDLFSIGGTIVSQNGSSGGAVVRASNGSLAGIIVTDTAGTTTASRKLNAITLGHIDRSLRASGISGIMAILSGDSAAAAKIFNEQIAPLERQKLLDVLKKTQP